MVIPLSTHPPQTIPERRDMLLHHCPVHWLARRQLQRFLALTSNDVTVMPVYAGNGRETFTMIDR